MELENQQEHPKGLTCIVCLRKLSAVFADGPDDLHQPSSGTAFNTHGHYGSTVFDPMNSDLLEITVCDPCLVIRSKQGVITHIRDEDVTRWGVAAWTEAHVQRSIEYLTLRKDYLLYAGTTCVRYLGHDTPDSVRILIRDNSGEREVVVKSGDMVTLGDVRVAVTYVADPEKLSAEEYQYNTPVVAFQTRQPGRAY